MFVAVAIGVSMFGCGSASGGGQSAGTSESGSADLHVHEYTLVKAVRPTCTTGGNSAYYTCDCGKIFLKKGIDYVETDPNSVMLKAKGHTFTEEIVSDEYLVSEATESKPQVFAKACKSCGEKSTNEIDTFTYGKTLAEYLKKDQSLYAPVNLTMSLYDAANCVYGFTWNTETEPARPVLKIREKSGGEEKLVRASFEIADSYKIESGVETAIKYYSCKAEIALTPGTEYVYSTGDNYMGCFTESVQIESVDPNE